MRSVAAAIWLSGVSSSKRGKPEVWYREKRDPHPRYPRAGLAAEKVVVKDNRHLGAKLGKLIKEANAELANNANYDVVVPVKK